MAELLAKCLPSPKDAQSHIIGYTSVLSALFPLQHSPAFIV